MFVDKGEKRRDSLRNATVPAEYKCEDFLMELTSEDDRLYQRLEVTKARRVK